MKKKLIALFLICGFLDLVPLQGNQDVGAQDSNADLIEVFQTKILERNSKMGLQTINSQTNVITYEYTSSGVYCHCAYYSDCAIVTALNGSEEGKQIILANNGVLVDISNLGTFKSDYFIHVYPWGKVTSYSNKQIIKRK